MQKIIAAYVRVSTKEQNEASQRTEIEKWLANNSMDSTSVRWFVDRMTGDTLQRPAFKEIQKAIFMGEVSTVVVFRLDRLSRKLREGLDVMCDWCERGLRVVSVTQAIDFSGATGRLLAAVLLGIAEMEQETRRIRQAAGIEVAKAAGKYTGRKPGTTKAAPQRAAELKLKGLSIREIMSSLRVSRTTLFRYLKSETE